MFEYFSICNSHMFKAVRKKNIKWMEKMKFAL